MSYGYLYYQNKYVIKLFTQICMALNDTNLKEFYNLKEGQKCFRTMRMPIAIFRSEKRKINIGLEADPLLILFPLKNAFGRFE